MRAVGTPASLLVRPRLLGVLATRWQRRSSAVVAGAGYGKTTLLTQAVSENRLSPRGVDVYLACRTSDWVDDLTGRATAQLAPRAQPGLPLAEAIAAQAPTPVALVMDDLHLLDDETRAGVTTTVRHLPANAHVLIATRGVAPDDATVLLDEESLAFDEPELRLLAEDDDALLERLQGTAGWPALVAQVLHGGVGDVGSYLTAEILEPLPDAERRIVGLLASVGPVDVDTAAAVGIDTGVAEQLASRLPLLRQDGDGRFVVHDLWADTCRSVISRSAQHEARSRVAEAFSEAGTHDAAIDLAVDLADWDLLERLVVPACNNATSHAAGVIARRLLPKLPDQMVGTPVHALLVALRERWNDPKSAATPRAFEAAVDAFRAAGDIDGEVVALTGLTYVHSIIGNDLEAAAPWIARVEELAVAGHAGASAMAHLGRAVAALARADLAAALEHLDGIDDEALTQEWRASATWFRSVVLLGAGRADDAVVLAGRVFDYALARGVGGGTGPVVPQVLAGHPLDALATMRAWTVDPHGVGPVVRHDRAYHRALVHGLLGDVEPAEAAMAEIGSLELPATPVDEVVGVVVAMAAGDEARASGHAIRLRGLRPPSPVHPGAILVANAVALPYVVDPGQRTEIDERVLAGDWYVGLELARALVAARDGASVTLELPEAGTVVAHLGLRHAIELAVRLLGSQGAGAQRVVEGCIELRPHSSRSVLDELAASDEPRVRRSTRSLLATLPVPPQGAVSVRVLGRAAIEVDGVDLDHPNWRRERVRALLLHLVHRRRVRREAVAAALWPDHDAERSSHNLAVTLGYLNEMLEPDRPAGAATWFVRSDRTWFWLHDLEVDAWEFERLLDEAKAADDRGAASTCLALLERALELWRGQYLEDVVNEEWAQLGVDRMRTRFARASIRAAELLGAAGRADEAIARATGALEVEPWSEAGFRAAAAAHLAAGSRAAAQRLLSRCRDRLADLGVRPEQETVVLMRAVGGFPSI